MCLSSHFPFQFSETLEGINVSSCKFNKPVLTSFEIIFSLLSLTIEAFTSSEV